MRKILPADTLTPILAYMRVQGEHKVILESIPREKENARFSIVAYNPVFEVTFKDGVLYENGKAIDQDPFEYLDQVTVKGIKSDLPFAGGAIGFAGYQDFERDFYRYSNMNIPLTFLTDDILKTMATSRKNYFVLNKEKSRDNRDHFFIFEVSTVDENPLIYHYTYKKTTIYLAEK